MKKKLLLFTMLLFSWGMTAQAVDLYLIGENSLTNGWSDNNTAGKMTYDATNKVYTVTATLTGYFAFTTNLGNSWDQLNANRYGPSSDGSVPAVGTTTALSKANTSFNATSIAGEYKITVSLENNTYLLESVGDYTPTYTVVGSASACNGLEWGAAFEVTTNDMTLVSGTTYQLVVTGCTLEVGTTYEYKIAKDKGWTTCWPASNKQFTVSETAVYTITYTFNSSTNAVSETTTKTGEAGVITHTYNVAGAILLPTDESEASGKFLDGVSLWDAAANQMTTTDDVNYTITFTNVEIESGSTILFKICQDGAWSVSYGWGDEEGSVGTNNAWLYINYSGIYTVTFTFNAETHIVAAAATRTGSASPITVKFQKPDTWAKAYLYAWNKNDKLEWPGEEMTVDGNWMKFIINSGDSIIFNNGLENDALIQSADIPNVTADVCYIWQSGKAILDADCDGIATIEYVTVKIQKPSDWNSVYVHIWNGLDTENTSWNGTPATFGLNGWYSIEISKGANFLINSNDWEEVATDDWQVTKQTTDLTATADICYNIGDVADGKYQVVENTTCADLIEETVIVKFQKPAAWAGAYIYRWNNYGNNTWPGEQMTTDGDWVKLTIAKGDNIIINNGLTGEYLIQSADIPNVTADVCYLWQDNDAVLDEDCDGVITIPDDDDDVYAIVGAHQIINGDNDWAAGADDNIMTETATGVYTLEVTDATLETGTEYKYKVLKNNNTYIPNGDDLVLTVAETAVYKITYTYKVEGDVITAVTEKTGEAGEITHTYNVAGAIFLPTDEFDATGNFLDGDSFWNAAANEMSSEDDVNYTLTFTDVTIQGGSTVQFKICQDGAWGTSYGWDEDGNPGSGNAWIYIEDNGTYTFTFTFNATTHVVGVTAQRTDIEPSEDVYVVAGSGAALNGITWGANAEENKMTLIDGIYTLVVTDAQLEVGVTYEFKIVKNGETYIPDGIGNNRTFTVDETALYKVTYTYKIEGEEINVVTEKTGEAGPVTHTYTVAGSAAIVNGAEWTPENSDNDMVLNEQTGLYELTVTGCELTVPGEEEEPYAFKVVVDHAWSPAYPASNYIISITEDGTYDITYTFNEATKDINAVLSKKDTPTSVETIALDPNQPMYNILGIEVGKNYHGIVIQNGQKFLR